MRSTLLPLALLTTVAVAGCGYGLDLGDSCPTDSTERPARVVTEPEFRPAPEARADLVLDVTSTLEEPVRVTVELDGRTALDVEVPGSGAECAHQPVHRYPYDVPRERVEVVASTDVGQSASRTVVLRRAPRWVVVQVQEGIPLSVEDYDEQPAYG